MPSRARRVALASGAGGASVLLALAAHVLSGVSVPVPGLLAGLAVLTVLASTVVSALRLPLWAVLVLLAVSQQVLHSAFTGLADGGASSATGVPGAGISGHHEESQVQVPAAGASAHSPEVMILLHAHAAAALLAGLLVARWSVAAAWFRSARAAAPKGGGRQNAVRGRQA